MAILIPNSKPKLTSNVLWQHHNRMLHLQLILQLTIHQGQINLLTAHTAHKIPQTQSASLDRQLYNEISEIELCDRRQCAMDIDGSLGKCGIKIEEN